MGSEDYLHIKYEPIFAELKDFILKSTGLFYYQDKEEDLYQKIMKRATALRVSSCSDYLTFLKNGERGMNELDELIVDLTIGESYFFRHKTQFEALEKFIIPDVMKKNEKTKKIRIWNAACSTGEEPYSIAILLEEKFAKDLAGWEVEILATDINRQSLKKAQAGVYRDWSFRDCPNSLREKNFEKHGQEWVLKPNRKRAVTFQYHNLVMHPFPSLVQNLYSFDVIFCRNAMIYFNQATNSKIVSQFFNTLTTGGWLVMGHAELVSLQNSLFSVVQNGDVTLFKKDRQEQIKKEPYVPPTLTDVQSKPKKKPSGPARQGGKKGVFPTIEKIKTLSDSGRWPEAAQACKGLLKEDELNPTVYFFLALMQEQQGELSAAAYSFKQALYLDRGFALAHYHFGLLLQRQENYKEAVRHFKNVEGLVTGKKDDEVIAYGDGMTIGDLGQMARTQMAVLKAA